MIICLERLHQVSGGRNSRITQFKDYTLYREITKRNSCGARLSEEQAYKEYLEWKAKTEDIVRGKYTTCWYKFETFVHKTLSVILINVQLVNYFVSYVDYICAPEQEIDLYLEILLFVKLRPFQFKVLFPI